MPDATYQFNSLYIFGLLLLYNIFTSNYKYIIFVIKKILAFNYISFLLFITGIYLFLKHVSFQIHLEISYKT
jgi:hypothetical protein